MPEMKDSGIEWIGMIPKHWDVHPIYRYYGERKVKNSALKEQNLLSLSYGKIIRKDIGSLGGLLPASFSTYNIVEPNDIIIRPTDLQNDKRSLRTGLVTEHGIITSAYIDLMPKASVNSKYFHYLLHTYDVMKVFYNMGNGVRQGLNYSEFAKLMVFSPPINEQNGIAIYLDKKCSEIDALRTDIEEQIRLLEEYKKSVITEAVTKGLDSNVEMKDSGVEWIGMIPKHWKVKRGKYCFIQKSGKGNKESLTLLSPTQKYGVIPQSLYEELSGFSAVKLNAQTDYNQLKTVHKGAFVISLRSFQGGFEYSEYEGVVSPAYQVFYPTIPISDFYYKYLFKTQVFIDKINSYTMSLRDGKPIAFADFGRTFIPIPPVEEQEQIGKLLDSKCSEIDSLVSKKEQQLSLLEDYKKSLIYEYITGKKEVPADFTGGES